MRWMGMVCHLSWACTVIAVAVCHQAAEAAVIIEVDMDRDLAGIQDTISATAGVTVKAAIVLTTDADGVSLYGISANFDTSELIAPVVATELLPAGFDSNSSMGVGSVDTILGHIRNIEAEALAAGGPTSATFEIAHLDFTVAAGGGIDDGLADIELGEFSGADGTGDNNFAQVIPSVKNGFLIPEPSTLFGLIASGVLVMSRRCRRRA